MKILAFRVALATIGVMQFGDVYSTARALTVKGVEEANPVAAWLQGSPDLWLAVKITLGCAAILAAWKFPGKRVHVYHAVSAIALAKVYAVVIVNNLFHFV
jgi:hypothetical protein